MLTGLSVRRLLLATLLSTSSLLAGCQIVFAPEKGPGSRQFSTDGGFGGSDGSTGGDGDGDGDGPDASTQNSDAGPSGSDSGIGSMDASTTGFDAGS